MAAGTPVVASNLDAFRRVLDDGKAGCLVPVEDSDVWRRRDRRPGDDELRARYIEAATAAVHQYDWSVVADEILRVHETVAVAGVRSSSPEPRRAGAQRLGDQIRRAGAQRLGDQIRRAGAQRLGDQIRPDRQLMAPALYWSLTAVLVVILIAIAVWAFQTANRPDRLHVRYDLSWQALDSALARGRWWPGPSPPTPTAASGRAPGWSLWPTPPNGPRGTPGKAARTSCRRS